MDTRKRSNFLKTLRLLLILAITGTLFLSPVQMDMVQADDVGDVNNPPEFTLDNPYVTISEGHIATNSGTIGDPDGDVLTLATSIGSITDHNDGTWSWNYLPDDGTGDLQVVTISAEDGNGGVTEATFDLTVNNVAPIATFENDGPIFEGETFTLSLLNPSDPSSTDMYVGFEYAFDCGDGYSADSTSNTIDCPTVVDGVRQVKGRILDKDGGYSEYTADVNVNNIEPEILALNMPAYPIQIGTALRFTASFTETWPTPTPNPSPCFTFNVTAAFTDTPCAHFIVFWDWGDGSTNTVGPVTSPTTIDHIYTDPGVYTIALSVTDDDGDAIDGTYEYVVVYDPNDGFVTGAGWIDSPAGAYVSDPSLTGIANFGFVSKYVKKSTTPIGQTEFQFHLADLNFHSDVYEWLVVAGHKAMFKGSGTINGNGNYGFLISVIDDKLTPSSDSDLFRIKIWDKENNDLVVYDNQLEADEVANPTTALRGGNIVIHKGKK